MVNWIKCNACDRGFWDDYLLKFCPDCRTSGQLADAKSDLKKARAEIAQLRAPEPKDEGDEVLVKKLSLSVELIRERKKDKRLLDSIEAGIALMEREARNGNGLTISKKSLRELKTLVAEMKRRLKEPLA